MDAQITWNVRNFEGRSKTNNGISRELIHCHEIMAIDKESSGMPEVDLGRRTTKVNLAIIIGAVVFFAITFAVVMFYARRSGPGTNSPSPPTHNAPAP